MNKLTGILRRTVESSIALRQRLDFRAAQALADLHEKVVQIDAPEISVHLEFRNGDASVHDGEAASPDLFISGSLPDILQALVMGDTAGVKTNGDETLVPLLERVFVPPLVSSEFGSKARSAAEAATSSVVETIQAIAKPDSEAIGKLLDELASKIKSVARRMLDAEMDIAELKSRAGLKDKK